MQVFDFNIIFENTKPNDSHDPAYKRNEILKYTSGEDYITSWRKATETAIEYLKTLGFGWRIQSIDQY